ncbi:response regulator transcription factor [Arcticibacter tournemirensis]
MRNIKSKVIRFAIADSDPVFRQVLVSYLCASLERKVIFCASNGRELFEKTKMLGTDILIVNLFMPVLNGIESVQLIRKLNENVKILAVSSVFQPELLPLLQRYGVSGYCSKSVRDILHAFTRITNGSFFFEEHYFDQWKASELILEVNKAEMFIEKLSPAEVKIVVLCCQGMSNREIAGKLHFSIRTVDTYLSKIFTKLDIKSRHELVKLAYDNGICRLICSHSEKGYCELDSPFLLEHA